MGTSDFIWQEMSDVVVSVSPAATLKEAAETMRSNRFHHLPVMVGSDLLGIVSDRDVISESIDKLVADVMNRSVETCGLNATIGSIADQMIERRIHAMPVLDDAKRVVGIITSTDLLKYLRRTHRAGAEPFDCLVIKLNDVGDCED